MKRNPLTVVIGALLILIFALLLFVFQVRVTQVAVVTTFGKPSPHAYDKPGAYLKWPWPIQKVYYFDKRVQNLETVNREDLTADQFSLLTSVYIGWRITDAQAFFPKFANGSVAEAEKQLDKLADTSKSSVVGKHPLADFVSADVKSLKFDGVENEILTDVQSQVRQHNWGIEIEYVGIKKLEFPQNVTDKVFERMTAERQKLINKSQYEGQAEAQKIRSDADRRAAEMLAAARGEAIDIRGKGEAEAAKYLAVFQQNPQLANFIFRLNALEDSLKERSTLIFDQQTPPFDLFKGVMTNSPAK